MSTESSALWDAFRTSKDALLSYIRDQQKDTRNVSDGLFSPPRSSVSNIRSRISDMETEEAQLDAVEAEIRSTKDLLRRLRAQIHLYTVPIGTLPNEMLMEIFGHLSYNDHPTIRAVSLVSRQWRDLALATKELWSQPDWNSWSTSQIGRWIEPSHDYLLDVELNLDFIELGHWCHNTTPFRRLLEETSGRWRNLSLKWADRAPNLSNANDEIQDSIIEFSLEFVFAILQLKLPKLETLLVGYSGTTFSVPPVPYDLHIPSLRTLNLSGVALLGTDIFTENLESVDLSVENMPVSLWEALLTSCRNIKRLFVYSTSIPRNNDEPGGWYDFMEAPFECLPNLEELHIHDLDNKTMRFLVTAFQKSTMIPPLRSLIVEYTDKKIKKDLFVSFVKTVIDATIEIKTLTLRAEARSIYSALVATLPKKSSSGTFRLPKLRHLTVEADLPSYSTQKAIDYSILAIAHECTLLAQGGLERVELGHILKPNEVILRRNVGSLTINHPSPSRASRGLIQSVSINATIGGG